MADVIVPIIHLNGDRPETLSMALKNIYRALNKTQMALEEAAPNGRNYYPVDGLLQKAKTQYERRWQLLEALKQEILAEQDGIEQQRRQQ